jgi:alkyl sulfatase BDS1-like metallo-beta-lactamase superfamily hydrolase
MERESTSMRSTLISLVALAAGVAACSRGPAPPGPEAGGATPHTVAANRAVAQSLALDDRQAFEDARRGFVASDSPLRIRGPEGRIAWDLEPYVFLEGEAPPTVNPSLWRQAQLDGQHGLFEVVPGIWQVRGYDLSNMTLIEGRTGWIVVDPLTVAETAAAALALARKHLGDKPVSAVIFTHSHVDHFGGVDGVLPPGHAPVPIVAPAGFLEEATSENVLAGVAMGRRALYMYGAGLPRSATGHVDAGLGKGVPSGSIGLREPTVLVDRTPQPMEIDGVRFVFQNTPHSEAPAALTLYLPDHKAWGSADLVPHTLHNLYTLRGTKVRDALEWSGHLDRALELFGDVEVMFGGHQWPIWGNERVLDHVRAHRDAYRYIHDQTLRLANRGHTPREIAEQLELPSALRTRFGTRDYYGTVRHNAKAVYQAYFGWYDANPANLNPWPPAEAGSRYVAAMGGADRVLALAQAAHDEGDDRWAATLLDHLVFADPEHARAKELLARVYEQLGYQAESAPWRDVYLTGALELRSGVQGTAADPRRALGLLRSTPVERFLDSMTVRIDGPAADGKRFKFNFVFTDVGETHVLELGNGVLHHRQAEPAADADATVRLTRDLLLRLGIGDAGLKELVMSDELQVDGSRLKLLSFLSLLDKPDGRFAIVTP